MYCLLNLKEKTVQIVNESSAARHERTKVYRYSKFVCTDRPEGDELFVRDFNDTRFEPRSESNRKRYAL